MYVILVCFSLLFRIPGTTSIFSNNREFVIVLGLDNYLRCYIADCRKARLCLNYLILFGSRDIRRFTTRFVVSQISYVARRCEDRSSL
jgi:hypothetical protein